MVSSSCRRIRLTPRVAQENGDVGAVRAIGYEILADRQLALLSVNEAMARGVARGLVAGGKQ
jgi:hypothetical protein